VRQPPDAGQCLDADIYRQCELREIGVEFVLVTDSKGWGDMGEPLRRAVEALDWVLNLDFVKRGLLRTILLPAGEG